MCYTALFSGKCIDRGKRRQVECYPNTTLIERAEQQRLAVGKQVRILTSEVVGNGQQSNLISRVDPVGLRTRIVRHVQLHAGEADEDSELL